MHLTGNISVLRLLLMGQDSMATTRVKGNPKVQVLSKGSGLPQERERERERERTFIDSDTIIQLAAAKSGNNSLLTDWFTRYV